MDTASIRTRPAKSGKTLIVLHDGKRDTVTLTDVPPVMVLSQEMARYAAQSASLGFCIVLDQEYGHAHYVVPSPSSS